MRRLYPKICLAELNNNQNSVVATDANPTATIVTEQIVKLPSYLPTKVVGQQRDEFSEFMSRPLLYIQTPWTSTSLNALITTDIFKEYRNLANSTVYLGSKLKNFMYVDALLRVTFVVQGAAASQGTLLYCFDPRPQDPKTGYSKVAYPQRTRSFLLPHVEIDPSVSKTYTLDLPAPTVWGMYSMSTAFELGSYSMHQTIINALGSGTSDTSDISIAIYLSLVNPKLHSATAYSEFSSSKEELTTKEGGIISSFFNKASDISLGISTIPIPFISEPATIFSQATGALGKFFSWFGFSKPLSYDMSVFMRKSHNSYTKMDGKVLAQQMCLRSNNSVGISESISPLLKLEDMVCGSLISKPGLVRVFTISTVAATNTVVDEMTVSPALNLALNSPALTNGYELTPMSFVAFPYRFWRGTIDYKIKFVCSSFHRATILILYDPRATTSAYVNPIAKSALLNHWTVSVAGSTEIDISIPWSQLADYTTIGSPDTDHNTECNGELIFAVLNPVTTNGSIDPIHVNVFQSSRDLQLAELQHFSSEFPTFVELASGSSDPLFYSKYFGEEPAHTIKELASISTCEVNLIMPSTMFDGGTSFTFTQPAAPLIKTNYTASAPATVYNNRTLVDFLSLSYVGVRGSYVSTFMPNGAGTSPYNAYAVKTKSGYSMTPTGTNWPQAWQPVAVMDSTVDSALTVYQPYSHFGAFSVTGVVNGGKDDFYAYVIINSFSGNTNYNTRPAILKSAGEDFLFVGYRGTPSAVYPQFSD